MADEDGMVVPPAHPAEALARGGPDQERIEARVEAGASIRGLHPPGGAALAEYRAWRAGRSGAPE